jgi:hypothetical protein
VDSLVWKHSFFESSGEYSFDTSPFTSISPNDGFMLFDVDSVNTLLAPNYDSLSAELISPLIDLTGQTTAMLEIQQDFRFCCNNTHEITVSISSDGGTTWGTPYDLSEGMIPTMSYQQWNYGSFRKRINVTSQAAGNTILLKFNWDGNSSGNTHYYWSLDDVCIATMPENDVDVLSSTFAGEDNRGVQYARTWEGQVNQKYTIGAEVLNFGTLDQTDVSVSADFTSFVSAQSTPLLESDSMKYIGSLEILALSQGVYTGTYSAISNGDSLPNPGANEFTRKIEITDNPESYSIDAEYSLDGIGLYTSPVLSSIGTNSFEGVNDGLILGALYYIHATQSHIGMRIMLAPGTIPGGEFYPSIKDSASFWNDATISVAAAGSHTISAWDITNGYINICFSPFTLPPGAYYAAIELYSNGGANPVRVLDDMTITQPNFASAIYIPNDTTYSNGNAFAIRLMDGYISCHIGLDENNLNLAMIAPNPSLGLVNISNLGTTENLIEVFDLIGNRLLTKFIYSDAEIDLSGYSSGIYVIKISNDIDSISELIVIE